MSKLHVEFDTRCQSIDAYVGGRDELIINPTDEDACPVCTAKEDR